MAMTKVEVARLQQAEEENKILQKKLAAAEEYAAKSTAPQFNDINSEIKKIRAKSKPSASSITVVETIDHKNISLWTRFGKRIGPMHPDNAIQALNRFADLGIMLTADQPTQADIDAYKQSPEGKAIMAQEKEKREVKDKSRKSGQLEKLAKEIAKMSGTTVDAINHILKAHEVKSISGR